METPCAMNEHMIAWNSRPCGGISLYQNAGYLSAGRRASIIFTAPATRRVAAIRSPGSRHAIPPTAGAKQKEAAERPSMATDIAGRELGRHNRTPKAAPRRSPGATAPRIGGFTYRPGLASGAIQTIHATATVAQNHGLVGG